MPLFGFVALVVFILAFLFEVFGGPDWSNWAMLFLGLTFLTAHVIFGSVPILRR